MLQSECEAPTFAALGQKLLTIGYVNGDVVANGSREVPRYIYKMRIKEAHDIFKKHPSGPHECQKVEQSKEEVPGVLCSQASTNGAVWLARESCRDGGNPKQLRPRGPVQHIKSADCRRFNCA